MQADLFGTKKNRPDIKSGELPIPTFTYHLPLRGNHPSGRRRITDNRKDMLFVPLQWTGQGTSVERTGHRSEKARAPEWNKREDRGKAQGRRKIWSREKKEQERRLWEMNRLWGKTTEKLWEITLSLFISHKLINWE